MTTALSGKETAGILGQRFSESVISGGAGYILVDSDSILAILSYLKIAPEFQFDFLSSITAVDYFHYFEVVYHLTSMQHNHSLVIKTRCEGRNNLSVPSIISLYQGADLQEREIFDLLGIKFEGHPEMRRILLWEGFEGHPLRKDYL